MDNYNLTNLAQDILNNVVPRDKTISNGSKGVAVSGRSFGRIVSAYDKFSHAHNQSRISPRNETTYSKVEKYDNRVIPFPNGNDIKVSDGYTANLVRFPNISNGGGKPLRLAPKMHKNFTDRSAKIISFPIEKTEEANKYEMPNNKTTNVATPADIDSNFDFEFDEKPVSNNTKPVHDNSIDREDIKRVKPMLSSPKAVDTEEQTKVKKDNYRDGKVNKVIDEKGPENNIEKDNVLEFTSKGKANNNKARVGITGKATAGGVKADTVDNAVELAAIFATKENSAAQRRKAADEKLRLSIAAAQDAQASVDAKLQQINNLLAKKEKKIEALNKDADKMTEEIKKQKQKKEESDRRAQEADDIINSLLAGDDYEDYEEEESYGLAA